MNDRNIAELFETMSLIAKKSMEEQDFSGTVIGKVVERISLSDSYLVNYQGVEILASSMGNAYSIGDEVIILVPNKDLNAQKFILGRTNSRTPTIGIGDDGSLSDLNIDYLQEIMEEVNNLLSDGKLTPKEKEQLAMNWDGIKADHEEVLSSSVDYPQVDLTSLKEYYKNLERLMNKVLSDMDNPTEEDLDELRKSMATYTIENRKVKNSVLEEIKKDISYSVSIISSNGESFKNGIISTQLRALVYKGKGEITSSLPNDSFSWKKLNERGEVISGWSHTGREVGVTEEDVDVKQIFRCSIEIEGATVAQDIVTLIDLSDGESLELTLESNMSRTQVYDKNSGKFTPDWSATNLVVDAKGTINGVDKTKDTRFTWFLNGQELLRADDRITISATGDKITFKKNILNSDDSVYLLTSEASYNNRDGIVLKNIKSIDLVLSINGENGTKGSDGKTSYTHFAWSNSEDGKLDFTLDPKEDMKYSGIYSSFSSVASTEPSDYTWTRVLGTDGKGIESTTVLYQIGDSGTEIPNKKWTSEIPAPVKGKYLWTRTIILYTDKTVSMSHSVSYFPTDGQKGVDGNGILKTVIEYQIGNDGTNPPGGEWVLKTPEPQQGKYLWTKTTIHYTNKTSSIGYSTSYFAMDGEDGKDGTNGVPGTPGKDGRTHYLHTAWANSSDGEKDFLTSYPATGKRAYIGTYSDYEEKDSTDPAKYEWARILGEDGKDGTQGVPGKPGADGKTPYFHTAWANSHNGKEDFTINYPTDGSAYSNFSTKSSSSWESLVLNKKKPQVEIKINSKDDLGNVIATRSEMYEEDSVQKLVAQPITGYNIIGDKEKTVTIKKGLVVEFKYEKIGYYTDVEVRYMDGSTLIEKEMQKHEIGIVATFTAKNINNYVLIDDKERELTVVKDMVVVFKYKKPDTIVSVKSVDETGKLIKEDKPVYTIGTSQTFHAPKIDGYELNDTTPKTVTIAENTVVTFKYNKIIVIETTVVTVSHFDKKNNKEIKQTKETHEVGKSVTFKAETITDYTLIGANTQTKTVVKDMVVKFEYNPVDKWTTVITKHIDRTSKAVLDSTEGSFIIGSSQVFNSKTFEGYNLYGSATQTKTITAGLVVTFEYDLRTINVPVLKIDIDTHREIGRETSSAKYGENKLFASPLPPDGYERYGDTTQRVVVKDDTVITFYYKAKPNGGFIVDTGANYNVTVPDTGDSAIEIFDLTTEYGKIGTYNNENLFLSYDVVSITGSSGYMQTTAGKFLSISDGWIIGRQLVAGQRYTETIKFKTADSGETSKKLGILFLGFPDNTRVVLKAPKLINASISRMAPRASKRMSLFSHTLIPMSADVRAAQGEERLFAETLIDTKNQEILDKNIMSSVEISSGSTALVSVKSVNANGAESLIGQSALANDRFLEIKSKVPKDCKKIRYYVVNGSTNENHVSLRRLQIELGDERNDWIPSGTQKLNVKTMTYIGTYSSHDPVQSLDYRDYTWAKFSGDNGISPLQISFNHPNGTVFRDIETKLTELSIDGIVYQGEKEVSSDLEVIKWFYRDTSIIPSSPNYDIDGGPGWSYITDKNTIGGNLIDYSTSKLIVKEGAVDASSTFKMFVRYDGVATSGTTTLIDIEDPIQVIIEGNGLFKKGGTNKLEARVFIGRKELPEKEIDEKFEFSWRLSKVTSKARSASTGWPKTGRIIEVNEDEIPDGINNGIVCEIISK